VRGPGPGVNAIICIKAREQCYKFKVMDPSVVLLYKRFTHPEHAHEIKASIDPMEGKTNP